MKHISVAIDGPVGAGKSTIAKKLAQMLGYMYLDTGATFRTVALSAINSGIKTSDNINVAKLMDNIDIKVEFEGTEQINYLNGKNVNSMIRTPEVSMGASDVGVLADVRQKLVEIWRNIANKYDIVMEGRDIGTNALPDADYKFFLTASVEERALRRYKELIDNGCSNVKIEQVTKDIELRDKQDSTREVAPLKIADDAIIIDSTDKNIQNVLNEMLCHIKRGK